MNSDKNNGQYLPGWGSKLPEYEKMRAGCRKKHLNSDMKNQNRPKAIEGNSIDFIGFIAL